MTLTMEIEGLPARVDLPYGGGEYEIIIRELEDKRFKSLEAAQKAVKDYSLKLRKGFTNPTAFLVRQSYAKHDRVEQVTVTSVAENNRECWIKGEKGEREKVAMNRLYASADAVQAAILSEMDYREAIAKTWAAVPGWQPEFAGQREER